MWVKDLPRNFQVGEIFTHTEPGNLYDQDDDFVVRRGRWRVEDTTHPVHPGPAVRSVDGGHQTWTPYDYDKTWVWRPDGGPVEPVESVEDRVALVMELIAEMQA